jgi:hypothetical protein
MVIVDVSKLINSDKKVLLRILLSLSWQSSTIFSTRST